MSVHWEMRATVTVILAAVLVTALAARAAAAGGITSTSFKQRLRAGPVDLTNVHVTGVVDLGGRVWDHPMICRGCRFDGFRARRATFGHIVDLSGSTFKGPVDMSEATFAAPALFGPQTPKVNSNPTTFKRGADFSLATFQDLAVFQRAFFGRWVNFALARFGGQAVFALGEVAREAHFERATFLGTADFGVYRFDGDVSFADATFASRTDFSQVTFTKRARFDRTRFDQGATFQSGTFGHVRPDGTGYKAKPDVRFYFDTVSAGEPVNFAFGTFVDKTDFANVQVAGPLSFTGARFNTSCIVLDDSSPTGEATTSRCVDFQQVSTSELQMSVGAVRHAVEGSEQPDVLAMIESGAKTHDDLALANNAHYELKALESHSDAAPEHVLDFVFYRTVAGYFVRPLNPLFVLLALVAAMSLWRALRFRPQAAPAAAPAVPPATHSGYGGSRAAAPAAQAEAAQGRRRRLHSAGDRILVEVREFAHEALDTLSLVGRRQAEAGERPSRRIEAFFYRVLVVLVLIGFANSNPTLRQMLDALR